MVLLLIKSVITFTLRLPSIKFGIEYNADAELYLGGLVIGGLVIGGLVIGKLAKRQSAASHILFHLILCLGFTLISFSQIFIVYYTAKVIEVIHK
jgi:hypothetical protein